MSKFDMLKTPVRNRGILPENLLRYPGVRRSDHPINYVAALGAKAAYYTESHPLHASEGVGSPMHRLYQEGGFALLLGVGLDACSAIHTAEFLADVPYLADTTIKVLVGDKEGNNEFRRMERYPESSEYFPKLAPELVRSGALRVAERNDYSMSFLALTPAVDLVLEKSASDPAAGQR